MVESHSESKREQERHVVTGGGGYAGFRLGLALSALGHDVVLFDVNYPEDYVPCAIRFVQGDICNAATVEKVLEGADCVYHMASYGMSGREQLNKSLIESVNIGGTQTVIKACHKLNIGRLVYTSTYNVVFGGQVIENGDETLPYLPLHKHPDHYSRTKSIAEKAVLAANGSTLSNGASLSTCALRLAGVYGPGERRHLPRIVGYLECGLYAATYGDERESLTEFLHVDNLVQSHVKAGQALGSKGGVSAGQAYFISDCKPVNAFQFFKPLIEGLGYKHPTLHIPIGLVYFMAYLIEWVHFLVGQVYNFQPLLTRTEVYKTGVTHYFSNAKAKEDLGYSPTIQNDLTESIKWFANRGHHRTIPVPGAVATPPPDNRGTLRQTLFNILVAVLCFVVIMSFIPSTH